MVTTAAPAASAERMRLNAVRMTISFEDVAVLTLSAWRAHRFAPLGLPSIPHPRQLQCQRQ
ncbi:hypothetical protein CSX11_00265 [Mycobacterium goodii]|nr:hypothetical protein CSX11_00265 [Mycolicibacterium goodii]